MIEEVELAPVETVRPGDEVEVGKIGRKCASSVDEYEDGAIVVSYFSDVERVYENRARDKSGFSEQRRLVERSLCPMRAGDVVAVVRGPKLRAAHLRKTMERGQAERNRLAEERWRRAAQADAARKASAVDHVDPPADPATPPRTWMCACGHRLLSDTHALYREATAPGTPYRTGRCLVDGCTCPKGHPETDGPR